MKISTLNMEMELPHMLAVVQLCSENSGTLDLEQW